MMVLTATQSGSLKAEIVGFLRAGRTPRTAGRSSRWTLRSRPTLLAAAIAPCSMRIKFSADSWKREKAENLILMLQGAIAAASKVGLLLNVHRDDLPAVLGVLPALKKPTISALSDPDWVAVNTIIEEAVVRQILPKLKAAKAQGIVEYPLNKIVL